MADAEAAAGVAGSGPLAGTDVKGVWVWIDIYCRANPTVTIETAALNFAAFAHPRSTLPKTPR
jgi:hypothetical protein